MRQYQAQVAAANADVARAKAQKAQAVSRRPVAAARRAQGTGQKTGRPAADLPLRRAGVEQVADSAYGLHESARPADLTSRSQKSGQPRPAKRRC
jgi:hypothetical protein